MGTDLRDRAALDVPRPIQDDDALHAISPRAFHRQDWALLGGSALSSFCLIYLILMRLLPSQGAAGFIVAWYLVFLATYRVVVGIVLGTRLARERLMTVLIGTTGLLVAVPVVLICGYVLKLGWEGITWAFLTKDLSYAGPIDPYNAGGAAHAIVGTLQQVALSVLISVPLGILCAVFLNEVRGPLRRPVRIFVDAMSGVPTIVAGLFIYATWIVAMGQGFSGWAASMAISISMLPIVTRTAEEVLRLVPDGLREASLALGTSEWRTVRGVVLPTARAGLVTAVVLGIARAVGETAPLIMTSFNSPEMNWNPFSGPQASLPIFIFRQFSLGLENPLQRAWSAALTLIVLVLILFTAARLLSSGRRLPGARRRAEAVVTIAEPVD